MPNKKEIADDGYITSAEFKEFSKLFSEMLAETQDELNFEKVLDKLLDRTQKEIDFIANFNISLD
jgi:hypothetical protein